MMVTTEYFTSYVWLHPLKNKTAAAVAECIFDIFFEGGAPQELLSDQGTEFCNEELVTGWPTIALLCRPRRPS